jgi:DNA-binding transcriptional MerR regulator
MARDRTKWLLVGEVAEMLGVHPDTVRRAYTRGELGPKVRTPGGVRWISRRSAEELRAAMYPKDAPEV